MKSLLFLLATGMSLMSSIALAEVPSVELSIDRSEVAKAVANVIRSTRAPETKRVAQSERVQSALTDYMSFLNLKPGSAEFKETLTRLLNSSTQMILCDSVENWACLEQLPEVPPSTEWRRDTRPDLGAPVHVKEPLQMESYFTKRWAQKKRGQPFDSPSVASIMGDKIIQDGTSGVYMALYGIDDIDGSMKPVYGAIQTAKKSGREVLGVFDIANETGGGSFLRDYDVRIDGNVATLEKTSSLDFSYVPPADQTGWIWGRPFWLDEMLAKGSSLEFQGAPRYVTDTKWLLKQPASADPRRINFQYKGTMDLITELNNGIRDNMNSKARIEWPSNKIMHNKFVVLDNNGQKSVWSGTANVAQTCMGDESNSNMSIYIKNTQVAEAFLTEFREMYEPREEGISDAPNLITGRFHVTKRPNTKRYFVFADGNELRVHFSPTDDGEHRAIIPMLLSARKGDQIRISMFGAGGHELVRALQFAAAQGADVRVLLDSVTGNNRFGWMKNPVANVFEQNPYAVGSRMKTALPISTRISTWLNNGLNHHKTASLTRHLSGGKYRVETLIVGSQNWSASGNDGNDENMVTIRNLKTDVAGGLEFNQDFDQNLWPLAQDITQADLRNMKPSNSSADEE